MVETLAIIPARGGSKGLPRKNLAMLGGHPLIAWSIASAKAAKSVGRTIVSTDDEEIAEVARHYGAEVPFLRPKELAQDDTLDLPVFQHALGWLADTEGYRPELIVQLRPTSPLRKQDMIITAMALMVLYSDTDSVRSITTCKEHPFKMWRDTGRNHRITPYIRAHSADLHNEPRQRLEKAFWQTGHLDVIRRSTISELNSMTGSNVGNHFLDRRYCIDIDTQDDLEFARWALEHRKLDLDWPDDPALPDIKLLVLDFDGVLTDNRVYVNQDGVESVACSKSDGMGIWEVQQADVLVLVLSHECNATVEQRCAKMRVEWEHGKDVNKVATLECCARFHGIPLTQVAYIGNDINDLEAMKLVGLSVAVADAHPRVLAAADLVLTKPGGQGAVREFCDMLLKRKESKRNRWNDESLDTASPSTSLPKSASTTTAV